MSEYLRICDILMISENVLRKKGIDNSRLNAELLLAAILKTERINLYLDFEKPLSKTEINAYREKIKRRLDKEPLQYILGYCEFHGMKFKVTPDALIPRPETETLVEESIKLITSLKKNVRVLEIGTGSGCISIAIAKHCECTIDAIDIDEKALKVAAENLSTYNLKGKINLKKKDIFNFFDGLDKYDVIICNPPYIPADEFKSLPDEIKKYEPRNALTDKKDGLSHYRKITELAIKAKKKNLRCLFEIGDGKREKVEKVLKEHSILKYDFLKDLQGIDRVLRFET